jgi:hypothetical protein
MRDTGSRLQYSVGRCTKSAIEKQFLNISSKIWLVTQGTREAAGLHGGRQYDCAINGRRSYALPRPANKQGSYACGSDAWLRIKSMCEFKLVVVQLADILQHQREYFIWNGIHRNVGNILFFFLQSGFISWIRPGWRPSR